MKGELIKSSIEPIRNVKGVSYKITAPTGYDSPKKAICHRTTWKPSYSGMTENQMKKAATADAYKFEELIRFLYIF